jgi:hypothetical protein
VKLYKIAEIIKSNMKNIVISFLIILVLIAGCSQNQISSEDSNVLIKKDLSYDYEILYFGEGSVIDNYYVLMPSDLQEEDFNKFFYYVREKECKKKCNIGFFDDRNAYKLLKESSLDDENYIAEHFISMLTIDPNNEIIIYPLQDPNFSM